MRQTNEIIIPPLYLRRFLKEIMNMSQLVLPIIKLKLPKHNARLKSKHKLKLNVINTDGRP